MSKIKDFIGVYRTDIALTSILFVIFLCLTAVYWGHSFAAIVDFPREAYIPSQMLKGKLLYRDLFNLYAPLSYQVNAIAFKILGEKFDTLYFLGAISAFTSILSLYFIAKTVTDKFTSFATALTFMIISGFNIDNFNLIIPYSYAITYALSSFLLSVLFCVKYLKTSKPVFILLSFFFISLSLMFKYDFAPFLVILFAILFYKPINHKFLLLSLIISLIIPFLSFYSLYLQGLTFNDFIQHLNFIKLFSESKTYTYFISHSAGFYYRNKLILCDLRNFITVLSKLIVPSLSIYLMYKLMIKDLQNKTTKYKVISIIFAFDVILILYLFCFKDLAKALYYKMSFISLTTALFLLIGALKVSIDKKHNLAKIKDYLFKMDIKDKIFCFLAVTAIISCLKSFFYINIMVFGVYLIPLPLLINIILIVEYVPRYIQSIDITLWKTSFLLTIILSASLIPLYTGINKLHKTIKLNTEKGTFYSYPSYVNSLNSTLNYINKNIPKNATIVMLPEGLTLNFLTDRFSTEWYYSLIPNHLETFGENKVIEEFSRKPPDYIFINNRKSHEYAGYTSFCTNYGKKLCKFISSEYIFQKGYISSEKPKTSSSNFYILILKHKGNLND